MKLLIVEDDRKISSMVKKLFQSHMMVVDQAFDAREGLRLALTVPYDGIILDYYLPEFNGEMFARSLRVHKKHVPIIMLTAESDVDNVVRMLSTCDDYITKPFRVNELTARVKAVLRRGQVMYPEVLEYKDLVMDCQRHTVRRELKELELRTKEFTLLEYLLRNAEKVLTRMEIMEHVWDREIDPLSNSIDVHVRRLRQKVDSGFSTRLIQTVIGRGYRLKAH